MKRSAFTLIELLVVIAIIGLLSTIAVVSLVTARDKGKIAAGQSFDQSLRNGLGDQLVGEWLFNECSGNTASDASGNGNTATWSGGAGWSTSNAPGNTGCSANFSGSNYLSSTLNLQATNATFTTWIYPTSTTGYNTILSKLAQYEYRIHDGNLESLMSCAGVGWSYSLYLTGPQIPANSWSMVALSINSVNQTMKLFFNGHEVGKTATCTITAYNSVTLAIGSYSPIALGDPFHGNIDDTRVYSSTLSLAQIKKMYAEGLRSHQVATVVTE